MPANIAATHRDPEPRRIGRYEVVRELGRGAMGRVYLARDRALGRLVALKTFRGAPLLADPDDSASLRRRVLREAQQAGMLSHPNVVVIHDVVEPEGEDGDFYIVMEYVEGGGLDNRLREQGPMSLAQTAPLVGQIASALDHLHARGIVHRDVKPANVLVADDGRIKITDFGVSRVDDPAASGEEDIFGTPQYMAPEQIQGRALDARTDVFALGVLVYELLTGRKPFPGTTVAEVTHRIVYESPVPPAVDGQPLPTPVQAVLGRALAKDPAQRFASAGALAEAVRALAEGRSEMDVAATAAFPRARWLATVPAAGAHSRPRPQLVLGAVLALLALMMGLGAGYLRLQRGDRARGSSGEQQARQLGYVKLVNEGRRLLAAGDPEAAALLFQSAEGLAVHPERARKLRQQAELAASEAGKQLQLVDAKADLQAGRYDKVIAAARDMLGTKAGRDQAALVLTQVQQAIAHQRAVEAEQRTEQPAAQAAAPALESVARPVATAQSIALPTGTGLHVELRSDAPEGVLSLWIDGREAVHEPFAFYEHGGFLGLRKKPASGRWNTDLDLEPGPHSLRVLVGRTGEPARVRSLDLHLQADERETLAIYVPYAGQPYVVLR